MTPRPPTSALFPHDALPISRTPEGRSVVVSGTDFDKVRKLDNWWSVTARPQTGAEAKAALVGIRAAKVVTPEGRPFDLSFKGRKIHLAPAGTLKTGAAEDNRVYLSLSDFESWTGLQPYTIEIAVSGSAQEVNGTIRNLQRASPDAEVRPVRQIVEGEARVLGKMRSTLLASAVLIILTAALCLLATLTGWVFDRRRDFAIMKALGASAAQ